MNKKAEVFKKATAAHKGAGIAASMRQGTNALNLIEAMGPAFKKAGMDITKELGKFTRE